VKPLFSRKTSNPSWINSTIKIHKEPNFKQEKNLNTLNRRSTS
jgi:hypothetical protein